MKISLWKKILSYLYDVPIETTGSEYNPVLDVLIVKGRYQLCTEKAIYSYADKYDNFFEVFKQINLPKDNANVLLLGFGLGSIPYMVEQSFGKKYRYTGVEIDEEVVRLASKYVVDELKSDIQIITADAFAYMSLNSNKYDLVCMDIFDSDIVPEIFETEEFLNLLKGSLSKNGLLIYNRLYQTSSDIQNTNLFFNKFKSVFEKGRSIIVLGNKMLLSK